MHFSTDNILQPFQTTWLPADTRAAMLRLDRLHPLVSGNKWFKLKYNLEAAQGGPVVTFGGAYSNHILATAAACHMQGIHCTGIIRGERPPVLSPTLLKAVELGMELVFVSRETYRQLTQQGGVEAFRDAAAGDISAVASLQYLFTSDGPLPYIIPEGGHNALGVKGCEEILSLADVSGYTHIICAVGTGTTLAGLINSQTSPQITGISVLKGAFSLTDATANLLHTAPHAPWEILHDFHGGGYGKCNDDLIAFMNDFFRQTGIPLDRVYTGKMTLAVQNLLQQGYFPPGSRLLLIHSGGLQGNDSLPAGVLCY